MSYTSSRFICPDVYLFTFILERLLRMDQMQMTSFFQDELVKDFLFDDDDVIDSLKDCLELLHKNKLDTPPPLSKLFCLHLVCFCETMFD
ncbi:unnamed protein product [Schistosoma curassoni]|uniref:Pre-rRNA-processing protein TSR2 homolog n=1 Tax=Schistosoma curassoni TaxID=6186 RepID=A0A183JN88_9TREM|nr:unnamed protein product [Schistosoma curassoni]